MAVPPIAPFGVHHIAVQCRDLSTMARFYERAIRLRVDRRWPTADGKADRAVWLRMGGSVLALEACDGEPNPPSWQSSQVGFHLLSFEIHWENRPVWLAHLQHFGVDVVHSTPWTVYVRDPEGNRIGLSHFPFNLHGIRAQ